MTRPPGKPGGFFIRLSRDKPARMLYNGIIHIEGNGEIAMFANEVIRDIRYRVAATT